MVRVMTMVLITLIKFLIIVCATVCIHVHRVCALNTDNIPMKFNVLAVQMYVYSLTNCFSCYACNKIKSNRAHNMNIKMNLPSNLIPVKKKSFFLIKCLSLTYSFTIYKGNAHTHTGCK